MDEGPALLERFGPQVLRQYALIADGERGVVVGPHGDFCWMCLPRWDSPAVFSSLLGGAGVYAVTPELRYVWGGRYEERSLIWRSRWVTTDGIVECREGLAFPGDTHTAVVLRRIRAIDRPMRMRVVLDVRADFGETAMSGLSCEGGSWTGRSGPHRFRWTGAADARRAVDGSLCTVIDVVPGRDHDLVLELSDRDLPGRPTDAARAWSGTESAWRHAVPEFTGTLADTDAQLSYAVLRGLTSSGGGMVAAATMSLPERAKAGRNYDYRYCWIRDQCYAGQAVAAAGPHPLLDDAVRFVTERVLTDGPDLRPAYCVDATRPPSERDLPLPGYPGARAKAGNWVGEQFQLDTFGEALLLLAAAGQWDRLDSTHWGAVHTLVDAIEKRCTKPDAGIWELDNRRWAHSRLMCAAGLRRIAGVAPPAQGARWQHLADKLVSDTGSDCLHRDGRWQRAPDDPGVDAALLLPGLRGAVPADDARTRTTLTAVRRDLTQDGFVYRYRVDQRGLGVAEGAFLLCSFVLALADHQQGEALRALQWFERGRTACGPPGLLTEEYDVGQRQLRGNLPQAFAHALLFEAAHLLTRPGTDGTMA
ncbi:glycoside hydrolase family 15 protein [[Mycobacterium] kokjensenii]|uniref:Glycoside hydrolase family 15 protein n=1 Tax=[Mycobacterium] kokjensenii TaxID=3064287 RepID=A0ABN9N870_9MYCO|nr:glycoside hydrolase family 15 protein [Mycolicibacter sp. MU0083]CAJ1502113.1 glycoside hydrolase family 15 protein [Mycolicibacter sp. MU0083]